MYTLLYFSVTHTHGHTGSPLSEGQERHTLGSESKERRQGDQAESEREREREGEKLDGERGQRERER